MKNLLSTLFALLIFIASINGQTSIKGVILDETQTPMDYCNVLLLNAADSTLYKGSITENGGKYTFDDVAIGEYIINASLVGFGEIYSSQFSYNGNSVREIEPLALTNGIEIEEITVTAKKPFIELKADKMVVNVENSSVNAGNSALEVLQKSPGVIIDNNNNIILRGKEGVLVTINGKNQYMTGDEITRLLENMPSSNIKSIEIITNPSAKYDAEGNTGIINIVLKKNENLGSNGNLSSTLRQGWTTSHFHNLNLNYRSEKVNVYGSGEYYDWGWKQNINLLRDIPFEGGNTIFDQVSTMNNGGDGYNASVGMDINLTQNTTLGLLAKRNEGGEANDHDNQTFISGTNKPSFDILDVQSTSDENYLTNTFNVNLTQKLGDNGSQISFDTDYSLYDNDEMLMYDNTYMNNDRDEVAPEFLLRNTRNTSIDIFASQLDYSLPVNDRLNLEMGAKVSMVETTNNTLFEYEDEGQWINQVDRSNDFKYKEDVWAGYVNGSGSIGSVMIQAGLRLEHTESEGNSITLDTITPRSYTNLFPSLSLSKTFGEKHNISATYSRRLERPNYKSLNPFESYLDQYTFEKGNPLLNPQYSNSFGLNYAMGRQLFVAANYSHTSDAITEVIEQLSSENQTFQTEQNLSSFDNVSLTISKPIIWAEYWTSRVNYTGFYNKFSSDIPSGQLDNSQLTHMVNVNNEIQLPGDWGLEVSGRYQSKITFGLFEIDPQGSLDFGLSRRILDGRGSIKLNVNDVFRTNNSQVVIKQDDIDLVVDQRNDTRRVSLNFSYSFGNLKVKGAKKRKTAASDESSRI